AAQAASAATTGSGGGSAAGTAPVTAPRAPAKKAAPATKAPKATKATPAKPGEAAGTTPRSSKKPVAGRPADVPYDCRGLQGVSRDVCVQCADVPIYKRVVCEQKAFWSLCKGKRLFTDAYCQQNQSLGRGEGG